MGAFQKFLNDKKLEASEIARLSSQLEAHSDPDRALSQKHWAKRRDKESQGKSYAELSIGPKAKAS